MLSTTRVSLRTATLRDADALFEVHRRSVQALCASAYSASQMAAWFVGRSPTMYTPALMAGRIWLAELDDEIIGFVGAVAGEVTLLFVTPEAAGRAVGRTLFAIGLQRAAENFDGPLTVIATKNAVPFYRRHGFVGVEELFFERGKPPVQVPVVKMLRPFCRQAPSDMARSADD